MLLEFVLGMNNLAAGGTPGGTPEAAGGTPGGTPEAAGGTPALQHKKGCCFLATALFMFFCAMLSL